MEKYVLFRLASEIFALPIHKIDKIIDSEGISKVPDVDNYLMGIKVYQHNILPVVDLANRFFKTALEKVSESQVMVIHWNEKQVGLAVDEVLTVAEYDNSSFSPYKFEGENQVGKVNAVTAFVKTDEHIVSLIDSDRLFNEKGSEDISRLLRIESIDVQTDEEHAIHGKRI